MAYSEAFILGFQATGEYDRRFSLLSEKQGKMNAVCKSILKPGAKLAGHLDFPNFVWLELVWSNRGWQITQALEKASFPNLRKSPGALKAGLQAAGFLNDFLFPANETGNRDRNYINYWENSQPESDLLQQNKQIFSVWQELLNQLEFYSQPSQPGSSSQAADFDFLVSQMVLKTLAILGFLPDILTCANCGQGFKKLGSPKVFYFENQFFCANCALKLKLGARQFNFSTLMLIRQLLKGVWLPNSSSKSELEELSRLWQNQSHLFMV